MKSLIFVHQGVSGEAESAIAEFGYIAVRLPSFWALGPYVCGHPDSLLFPLPDGRMLLHSGYYAANRGLFDGTGLPLLLTDEPVGGEYPRDVLLNALSLGGALYGRMDSVSHIIKDAYPEHINVRQGYARCSVLALSGHAAVTADRGLAGALMSRGVDVLLLPPGGIMLRAVLPPDDGSEKAEAGDSVQTAEILPETAVAGGFAQKTKPRSGLLRCDGFIGGCGVMLDDTTCGFFGDITRYPHYDALESFARAHGVRLRSLCSGPIEDLGGAVIVRSF